MKYTKNCAIFLAHPVVMLPLVLLVSFGLLFILSIVTMYILLLRQLLLTSLMNSLQVFHLGDWVTS